MTTPKVDAERLEEGMLALHELQADMGYLAGRVAADGSFAGAMSAAVGSKLAIIEATLTELLASRSSGEPVAWTTQAMLDALQEPDTICCTIWPKAAERATIPLYAAPHPVPSLPTVDEAMVGRKFKRGDLVTKIKGSSWTGLVVGFYSTSLTPIGYNVESENEPGSVQLYPEAALQALHPTAGDR